MKRVSVIIPSWNGRHLLPFSLAALAAQSEPHDTVVVDNGSVDGTPAWLQETHGEIRCLSLPHNLGFAGAVNAGLAATESPYVLVLNNDAAPEDGYIEALAGLLDRDAGLAACQGRILCHDDPTTVDSLGIRFDDLLRAHQVGWGTRDAGSGGPPGRIPGVTACAALYRRSALRQVADPGAPAAVFDPSFFAYYEDVDLALRLSVRGWEAALQPSVSCVHVGSATGIDGSWLKTYRLGRNYPLYLARHLPPSRLLAQAPRILARSLLRVARLPAHPRREMALWAGEAAALLRLPSAMLKGRRDRAVAGKLPRES